MRERIGYVIEGVGGILVVIGIAMFNQALGVIVGGLTLIGAAAFYSREGHDDDSN